MSDRSKSNLPFETDDLAEASLWASLEDLPAGEPSANLRRSFHNALDDASTETLMMRLGRWLGFGSNIGWLTATACAVLGFAIAGVLEDTDEPRLNRLAALEDNVAMLNRELIINRLENASANQRLKGVFDARSFVADDSEVARALLMRAVEDHVPSVRSAAIDALGPSLSSSEVGAELMRLLVSAESPIVQLALVDLVLRNGNREQLDRLLELASAGHLHADLIPHVMSYLGSEQV